MDKLVHWAGQPEKKVLGSYDIICIFKPPDEKYYVTVLTERPLTPEFIQMEIALKRRLVWVCPAYWHEGGARSLRKAQQFLKKLKRKLKVADTNVIEDVAFEVEGPCGVLISDWMKNGKLLREEVEEALGKKRVQFITENSLIH